VPLFAEVRYTIIPSDELDDKKTRLVRKQLSHRKRIHHG
jgi:hypothetical protein